MIKLDPPSDMPLPTTGTYFGIKIKKTWTGKDNQCDGCVVENHPHCLDVLGECDDGGTWIMVVAI